jgi:hypothetical protein
MPKTTEEMEATTEEYSTLSCLALISTYVGHSEDFDEATLVQQQADKLQSVHRCSQFQVGHRQWHVPLKAGGVASSMLAASTSDGW